MSEARQHVIMTDEWRQHISESSPRKGKHLTDKEKEHLRAIQQGKPKSELHKKHLSERRKELGLSVGGKNPRAKKVLCVETNIIYDCLKNAIIATGISRTAIKKSCLTGCLAGDYHWRFID